MKKFLFIILVLFTYNATYSMCGSEGIGVYPSTSEIHQNSIFIISGYRDSQNMIDSLNIGYRVYLKSENTTIELVIDTITHGMFYMTQALLKPKTPLANGATYHMVIENSSEHFDDVVTVWNYKTQKHEPREWLVGADKDTSIPTFDEEPKWIENEFESYGCGPENFANFILSVNDESSVYIKTELYDISTNMTNIYFLKYTKDEPLKVGHSMCAGAFKFYHDREYKIRFSLIDICGNMNNKPTAWISLVM